MSRVGRLVLCRFVEGNEFSSEVDSSERDEVLKKFPRLKRIDSLKWRRMDGDLEVGMRLEDYLDIFLLRHKHVDDIAAYGVRNVGKEIDVLKNPDMYTRNILFVVGKERPDILGQKLDGKISQDEYEEKVREFREQDEKIREIVRDFVSRVARKYENYVDAAEDSARKVATGSWSASDIRKGFSDWAKRKPWDRNRYEIEGDYIWLSVGEKQRTLLMKYRSRIFELIRIMGVRVDAAVDDFFKGVRDEIMNDSLELAKQIERVAGVDISGYIGKRGRK